MTGATDARDALQQTARAVYAPTHAAGAAYAKAYKALVAETDLVAAMGGMVEVIIAAEHLQEVAAEVVKTARATLAKTMNNTGATQIASGHHLAYLSRKPAFVSIEDPALVPAEYMHQPAPAPDNKAIREAIENGATVPGCTIVRPNEMGLGIKGKKAMNEIAKITQAYGYGEMERLAGAIAKSGLFGMKTPEQALVLMAISQAEGRHPALAARDYDIIQGRPAKKAEAMLRDFFEAGGKCEWHTLSDEAADATFSHPQGGSARINWNMERARTAGLVGKDNYKKFPRQMLRSRVVSEGVRTVWPLATSGFYVPEEAADIPAKKEPAFAGTTVDAEPELKPAPVRTTRKAKPEPSAESPASAPFSQQHSRELWQIWLDRLREAAAACTSRETVAELGGRATVKVALETAPQWVQDDISDLLGDAYAQFPEQDLCEELADEAKSEGDGWPGPAPV